MTDLEDKKRLTAIVARLLAEQFRAVSAEFGLTARAAIPRGPDSYPCGLVKGINETSRNVIEDALQKALTLPGFTRENLVAELAPTFGANRAEMIGVTEVTRAYSEGQQLGAQELKDVGIIALAGWRVNEGSTTRRPDARDDRDELPESEGPAE